jgi:hypothetical protein
MLERIVALRDEFMRLEEELRNYATQTPEVEKACEVLLQLNLAKRDFSSTYDVFAMLISEIMGNSQNISLPNGAQIEKKSAYDRKTWQHKELANAVADKLVKMSVDMDTGEVLMTPEQIAQSMLTYCAPSYWRVKELNSIGINADNYCESGELKTSIIVRKGDNQ